jgi:hypothetical protein
VISSGADPRRAAAEADETFTCGSESPEVATVSSDGVVTAITRGMVKVVQW